MLRRPIRRPPSWWTTTRPPSLSSVDIAGPVQRLGGFARPHTVGRFAVTADLAAFGSATAEGSAAAVSSATWSSSPVALRRPPPRPHRASEGGSWSSTTSSASRSGESSGRSKTSLATTSEPRSPPHEAENGSSADRLTTSRQRAGGSDRDVVPPRPLEPTVLVESFLDQGDLAVELLRRRRSGHG